MWVEIGLTAEDFCSDLVFLDGDAWVIDGLFGKVAKKLTKRLRAVERMAVDQTFDFSQELSPVSQGDSGDIDVT